MKDSTSPSRNVKAMQVSNCHSAFSALFPVSVRKSVRQEAPDLMSFEGHEDQIEGTRVKKTLNKVLESSKGVDKSGNMIKQTCLCSSNVW